MQRFLSLALALCLGLTFSVDADARRFGGGKSFGSMKHRQTQQQQQKGQQDYPGMLFMVIVFHCRQPP